MLLGTSVPVYVMLVEDGRVTAGILGEDGSGAVRVVVGK
jgi:hypothetical protein